MNKPRNLLFVDQSPYPSYGGTKRVVVDIALSLPRALWTPHALFYQDGHYVKDLLDAGIWAQARPELIQGHVAPRAANEAPARIPLGVHRGADGEMVRSRLRLLARDLRSTIRYSVHDRRLAKTFGPFVPPDLDLLHLNNWAHEHYEWACFARQQSIPFVTHEHGIWNTPPAPFRWVASHAAAVICLTEERAEQVRSFCGADVRAEVVPNGVDLDHFRSHRDPEAVRRALGVTPGTALIVTAGHYQDWKGQIQAVDAALRLKRSGTRFRWVLFGQPIDPSYLEKIRSRIETEGLSDDVVALEERSDVADLFAAADVAVHTSIRPEPFGLVVIEAMAMGTPVIGPREGALPSIIRHDRDGLLVTPRSPEALATALVSLLGEPGRLKSMGELAQARVRESFSVQAQVTRLTAIYERALSGRR